MCLAVGGEVSRRDGGPQTHAGQGVRDTVVALQQGVGEAKDGETVPLANTYVHWKLLINKLLLFNFQHAGVCYIPLEMCRS